VTFDLHQGVPRCRHHLCELVAFISEFLINTFVIVASIRILDPILRTE